jgi:LPXTG-motif cell wall-anchored protein
MNGDHGKENQEISVLGRLVSLEALVLLMGVASLIYGLATGSAVNIIIGALIVAAAILLFRKWRRLQPK